MQHIARQLHATLLEAGQILLIPHQHPDGDAVGSLSAIREWLLSIGKVPMAYCATDAPARFSYLPGASDIKKNPEVWKRSFDAIVVFDSGDLRYAGVEGELAALLPRPKILNIDHHATNEGYGDINFVDKTASSTAEMVYRFFSMNRVRVTPTMATCLMTGLMTDTDQFTNAATSRASLAVGSRLMSIGANLSQVQGLNFKDKSIDMLKLWGLIFTRLKKHETLGIVYTYFIRDDLARYQVNDTETEGIANFLNSLEEGRASLILKEQKDGTVKGSFRTTDPTLDVAAYAKRLGGGGHTKAAGFTMGGPIETAPERIFRLIEDPAQA